MTRKHFQQIATAMHSLRKFGVQDVQMSEVVAHAVRFSSVVDALAKVLAQTNPRFNRDRFLTACGIGAEESETKVCCCKLEAAQKAIDNEEQVCYDVCAEYGQIFGNVKRTTWFLEVVADAL